MFAGLLHEGKSIRLALPFQDLTAALPVEDRNLEFQPKALAEAQYELLQRAGRRCLRIQASLVSSPSHRRASPLTTTPSELTLARASSTENNTQYAHHVVEPSTQCPTWKPRRGGWRLAGVELVLTLGSLSRRRRRRSISDLAGANDWTGLGLGHPVAWPGESCMAHRNNGSGPLDHDRAYGRTTGNNPLSRSDGTRLGGLLDNFLLWVLQASRSTHHRLISRCNREQSTCAAIRTAPAGTGNTYHISIGSTSTSNLMARR